MKTIRPGKELTSINPYYGTRFHVMHVPHQFLGICPIGLFWWKRHVKMVYTCIL